MFPKNSFLFFLAAVFLTATACAVSSDGPGTNTTIGVDSSIVVDGDGHGDVDGPDEYVAGLKKTGKLNLVTVSLIASIPIPQDTGFYTWTLEVLDVGGAVLSGLKVVAEPTMPSHGHGSFPPTTTAQDKGDGRYQLNEMDLFMPGIWQVEIRIEADGWTDTVYYNFDLEG
jgi:hypothetical protein